MRIVQLMFLILFYISCRSTRNVVNEPVISVSTKERDEGLKLIAYWDCLTCHKVNESNVGPWYVQISKRYAATNSNINWLALKIISGGAGSWGKVPMTPHYDLHKNDAILMVKYILALNNFK
jgi:cytochrome c